MNQCRSIFKPGSDNLRNMMVIYNFFVQLIPGEISSSLKPIEPITRTAGRELWEKLRFTTVDVEDDDDEDDEVQYLTEMFIYLPEREEYPEYYEVIHNPIDLITIEKKLEIGHYDQGLTHMLKDIELLVKNCKTFNEPGSEVVQDALQLQKTYVQYMREYPIKLQGAYPTSTESLRPDMTPIGAPKKRKHEETLTPNPPEPKSLPMAGNVDDITALMLEEDEDGKITYPYMPAMADIYNAVIGYTVKHPEGGFTIHGPFMQLPPRDQFPDYYEKIDNPICLELVKERLEQHYYETNLEHLCYDLMNIFQNAKRYNEPGSDIHTYAMKLEGAIRRKKNDLYSKHGIKREEFTIPPKQQQTPIKRRKTSQPSMRSDGSPGLTSPIQQPVSQHSNLIHQLFHAMFNTMDENRRVCDDFMELPSKHEYPDYYKLIEKPIDMNMIERQLNSYQKIGDFLADCVLLFTNAKQFNEPGSEIFLDANKLETVLRFECHKLNIDKSEMVEAGLERNNRPLPGKGATTKQFIEYFMDELLNYRDPTGKVLAYPFQTLPSKQEMPEYYQIIKDPIDIDRIQKRNYQHFDNFMNDIVKMFENCCVFNETNSPLWLDAMLLLRFSIDLAKRMTLNILPEPNILLTTQNLFLRILEKTMSTKCQKTGRLLINTLRADIQLQGLIKMPFSNKLPPNPDQFPVISGLDQVTNNSGCMPSDPGPFAPNYYMQNPNKSNPQTRQPEMQRYILSLPGSIDQIHYILNYFLQKSMNRLPPGQKPPHPQKPKYTRLDILQHHVFTILREHRRRCSPGSELYNHTVDLQHAWIRARDELCNECFSSPAMNFTKEETILETRGIKYNYPQLPSIQGTAVILAQAHQQVTATTKVQHVYPNWNQQLFPKICALVPTTDPLFFLPATFPNELPQSKTDREFITTVGNIPNELIIVGDKVIEIPDVQSEFGDCTTATICSAENFCKETADYPVETLYMDWTNLYYARFESIERVVPLPVREVSVLMPRMPCRNGDRTKERTPVPPILEDLYNCTHDSMQFRRFYPTIMNKTRPTAGIGQNEKDAADQYYHQITSATHSGLKVGDVVWLRSDKSSVMSKIVRLWTRKDSKAGPNGQITYWEVS